MNEEQRTKVSDSFFFPCFGTYQTVFFFFFFFPNIFVRWLTSVFDSIPFPCFVQCGPYLSEQHYVKSFTTYQRQHTEKELDKRPDIGKGQGIFAINLREAKTLLCIV